MVPFSIILVGEFCVTIYIPVHIRNYCRFIFFPLRSSAACESPFPIVQKIEVKAFYSRVGHVVHPVVESGDPMRLDKRGVAPETKIESCAFLSEIPECASATTFESCGKPSVASVCAVTLKSFSEKRQFRPVIIGGAVFDFFGRQFLCKGKTGQKHQCCDYYCRNTDFFHIECCVF